MKAGTLDRPVILQRATVTQDAANQEIQAWTDFARPWARRRDMRGQERFQGETRFAARTAVYELRYLAGVDEEMRLIDNGITYQVVGIAEDARKGWLELSVEVINPGPTP